MLVKINCQCGVILGLFAGSEHDALDRFGTRLEHRFTQEQIEDMLKAAGLHSIRFSDSAPFWCVSAIKK